ncbi:hypothetical protein HDU92_001910 [Lobulomyces angularis]|nr:hypothetical protein HDU92_001910 [Lobulomyces angularis]
MFIPIIFYVIPLQNPYDENGYSANWAWAGIILPSACISLSIFPTYLVSTIMGAIPSSTRNFVWRFSSITVSSGITVGFYSILASLSPILFYSIVPTGFPVPLTPLFLGPLVSFVSIYTARLSSDWKLPTENTVNNNKNNHPNTVTFNHIKYIASRINQAVVNISAIYTLSMIASALLIFLFDKNLFLNSNADYNLEKLNYPFVNFIIILSALSLGKFITKKKMKQILTLEGVKRSSQQDISNNENKNIIEHVVIIGTEIWWNLSEILLLLMLDSQTSQVFFVPLIASLEFFYFLFKVLKSWLCLVKPNLDLESDTKSPETVVSIDTFDEKALPSPYSPRLPQSNNRHRTNSIERKGERLRALSAQPNFGSSAQLHDVLNKNHTEIDSSNPTSPRLRSASVKLRHDSEVRSPIKRWQDSSDIASPTRQKWDSADTTSAATLTPTTAVESFPSPTQINSIQLIPIQNLMVKTYLTNITKLTGVLDLYILYAFSSYENQEYLKVTNSNLLLAMITIYSMVALSIIALGFALDINIMNTFKETVLECRGAWMSLGILSTGWFTLWISIHSGI